MSWTIRRVNFVFRVSNRLPDRKLTQFLTELFIGIYTGTKVRTYIEKITVTLCLIYLVVRNYIRHNYGAMNISVMEPMLPRDNSQELENLAVELVAQSSELAGQIRPEVRESIGDLVRSMNCYYSNLIEGHNTHPWDIDRAMENKYSTDPTQRALQQEARAHIEVQRLIDHGDDPGEPPTSSAYVKWLHEEFCKRLPDDLLWVENPITKERAGSTRRIS